jgi:hypothetical protein
MRYVRVFAEPTDDNPGAPPFYVDAIVDDAGEILGQHALFGVQGDFRNRDAHFEPFVLFRDGKIDWGMAFQKTTNGQFGSLNLHDAPVSMDRLLRMQTINYGVQLYRIKAITHLPQT